MSIAVRAGGAADRSAWDVLSLSYGLRFVVQDMGNGVRRVLSPQLLPIDDAKGEAELPGRVPMHFPTPVWLLDLGFTALESLGVSVDRTKRAHTSMIYARDIDDRTVELVCWRA